LFLHLWRSLSISLARSLSFLRSVSLSLSLPASPTRPWMASALKKGACEIQDVKFYGQRSDFKFATLRYDMSRAHVPPRARAHSSSLSRPVARFLAPFLTLSLCLSLTLSLHPSLSFSPSHAPVWEFALIPEAYDIRINFCGQRSGLEFVTLRSCGLFISRSLFPSLIKPLCLSLSLSLSLALLFSFLAR